MKIWKFEKVSLYYIPKFICSMDCFIVNTLDILKNLHHIKYSQDFVCIMIFCVSLNMTDKYRQYHMHYRHRVSRLYVYFYVFEDLYVQGFVPLITFIGFLSSVSSFIYIETTVAYKIFTTLLIYRVSVQCVYFCFGR